MLPLIDAVAKIVSEYAKPLNSTLEVHSTLRSEMDALASQFPKYYKVMKLYGVNKVFYSQFITEIGDIRQQ